jgi:hypothetical protein
MRDEGAWAGQSETPLWDKGGLMLRRLVTTIALLSGVLSLGLDRAAAATCEEFVLPMDDGVRLYGQVLHEPGVRKPVKWSMTPYGATSAACREQDARFTRVWVDYRGTGASEGLWDSLGARDARDVNAIADWLAVQPWSNGSLLPIGASAEGAWTLYVLKHPAVKAAIPQTTCFDAYRGCLRPGGAYGGANFILTAIQMQGYANLLQTRIRLGLHTNPPPPMQLDRLTHHLVERTAHERDDAYWQQIMGLEHLTGVTTPILYTTDPYDYVSSGMYIAYEHTPGSRLTLTFGHNTPLAYRQGRLAQLSLKPMNRFIDHYIFGIDNGAELDPPVTMVTNMGGPAAYADGAVSFRGETSWPLPDTNWTRTYLGPGSLTLEPGGDGSDIAPLATMPGPKSDLRLLINLGRTAASQPRSQGVDLGSNLATPLLDDLRAEELAAVTYTTAPLAHDVEISGPLVLNLHASSTAPAFEWMVRVTDVWPDGRSSWITDGQLRTSLRRLDPTRTKRNENGDIIRPWYTFDVSEELPLNEPVEHVLEVWPTSNIFKAGHRIRLDVMPVATGTPDSARTGGVGAVTIHRGTAHPSFLLLPVVPDRCATGELGIEGAAQPGPCTTLLEALAP